ncbi:MAG: hypothetical protein KAQ94_05240 [Arcobacteraceae bacterium]|nr:hypothetical protein [Arcobacteraceae bacterium]
MEIIILVVIVTSAIQSLFGVGVILFGTPMLLLVNYPFLETLLILLPISVAINFLQITKDYKEIDFNLYKNIILFTVPFIILFLLLASEINVNLNLPIGLFLIFIAIKGYIKILKTWFKVLLSYNKIFYIGMGITHGITNLGGALLTAKISTTRLNKYQKRVTTAIVYMTFAIFQIVTILFLNVKYQFSNYIYIIIGLTTYLVINKLFFNKIQDYNYDKLFSLFLLFSGSLLVSKGIIW